MPTTPTPAEPSTASERAGAWLVAALLLGIGLLAINPFPVGILHDDAVYVILAKSLATGHGYRYLNLPGQPFATHFPPGYPLFLAALWRLWPSFPANVFLFKIANAALLVVGYLALVSLVRARTGVSRWAARGIALLAVAGVPMLFVSTLVLSETLFFALAAVALVLVERVIRDEASIAQLVVAGAVGGAAALVRTPGVALVVAALAWLVARRRVRDAMIVAAAAGVVLGPWLVWSQIHGRDVPAVLAGAYGSYGAWLGDAIHSRGVGFLVSTVALTTTQAVNVLGASAGAFPWPALNTIAVVAIGAILIAGLVAAWKPAPALVAFLVFYFVLVLVWPSPPARYVWGVWPFLSIIAVLGARALLSSRPRHAGLNGARVIILALALVPIAGYARYTFEGYRHRTWLAIPYQSSSMLRPLVLGIRDHVPAGATVASTAEAAMYLYTNRPTVPIYSFTVDELFHGPDVATQTRALGQILSMYPVAAVVGSTELQRSALRRVELPASVRLVVVDSFPGSVVYRCDGCGAERTR